MSFYRMAFDTYELIALCNVYLDDIIIKTIGMGSIIVEDMVK